MDNNTECGDLAAGTHSTEPAVNCPWITIRNLISGEILDGLCASFLTEGKGRRPTPPAVPRTYSLLLMLHSIKLQGNKTSKDVIKWFQKLFPDSHYQPDRFVRKMHHVASTAVTLIGSDSFMDYVSTPLNLDSVSPALDDYGINLKNIFTPLHFNNTVNSNVIVTNQIVVDFEHFRSKERLVHSFTVEWLLKLLSYNCDENHLEYKKVGLRCKTTVESTMKYYKAYMKRGKTSDELKQFLCTKFDLNLGDEKVLLGVREEDKGVEGAPVNVVPVHKIKWAVMLKKESIDDEENVKHSMREKFVANQQKLIDKRLSLIMKHSAIVANVGKHGGPCKTASDVDNLLLKLKHDKNSKSKTLEIFRNEIRYHKVVKGNKHLKYGSLTFMTNSLKNINFDVDDNTSSEVLVPQTSSSTNLKRKRDMLSNESKSQKNKRPD